jgi:hypothetical protein
VYDHKCFKTLEFGLKIYCSLYVIYDENLCWGSSAIAYLSNYCYFCWFSLIFILICSLVGSAMEVGFNVIDIIYFLICPVCRLYLLTIFSFVSKTEFN